MSQLLIQNIGSLYTLSGLEEAGGRASASIVPVGGAEVLIEDGIVAFAGAARADLGVERPLPANDRQHSNPYPPAPSLTQPSSDLTIVDAKGAMVTPGLVDPHTHIVYGGDRSHELALKVRGVPYLEILKAGGGIRSTVRATRAASDEDLYDSASLRLRALGSSGVTTVEIKSGYGLNTEHELRMLRVIQSLGHELPFRVVPTFMGAHAVPEEFAGDGDGYLDLVIDEMLPAVAGEGLAKFCDVFCEKGVFSVEQSRRVLTAAQGHGLGTKVHADEIEPAGGAELAAEVGAISAEHLRASSSSGLAALKQAGVVPVVLPATSFHLNDHIYADARRMIDEYDLPVALSTDDNPGTSPTDSMQLVMTIAALEMRLTPEEILAGTTIHAARAVGLQREVGSLEVGKAGDLVVWQAYNLGMLPYRSGANQAAIVIKGGHITYRNDTA